MARRSTRFVSAPTSRDGRGERARTAPAQEREEVPGIGPVVAGERLVGALAVEHDLDAGPARLGEHAPLREDRGRAEGLVLVPSKVGGVLEDVLRPREDLVRDRARPRDDRLHERALVDRLLSVTGRDRVDAFAPAFFGEHAAHQADDGRGIEPARKAGPDRHVGAQVQPHRLRKKPPELLGRLLLTER